MTRPPDPNTQNRIPYRIPTTKKHGTGKRQHVKYPATLDIKFSKIATTLGLNKRELFAKMVDYFYRTKKDPSDINDELLKNTLAKNHKAYTSFIKAQENLLLIPIKESVDRMITNQRDIVGYFNQQVLNANKTILKKLTSLEEQHHREARLKASFLHLLNTYIKAVKNSAPSRPRKKRNSPKPHAKKSKTFKPMYINITDSEKGNNKASSGDLVHYLDKENRLYKSEEPELWFNGNSRSIQSYEVKSKLDHNIAKLCRDDAKFFLINVSPSQKEIAHLNDPLLPAQQRNHHLLVQLSRNG